VSHIPAKLRLAVIARAGGRCEYCRLPSAGQGATFPLDHVIPESKGGLTELANLALACPNCNSHKLAASESADPATGFTVPLFNPRTDRWEDHFQFSSHSLQLEGKSPCGRATIRRLHMNAPQMVLARSLYVTSGFRLITFP
jgi:hypothetical protein